MALKMREGSKLALLLLSVLTLRSLPAGQSMKSRELLQHFEEGQEALKANRLDKAEIEFRKVLQIDAKNAEAYANVGLISYMRARYRDAAGDFRTAITLKPTLWNAQAYLGLSELRLGRAQDAVVHFTARFPHLHDAKLRAQVGLAWVRVHYEAKEFDQAVGVLRTLQKTNPNDPDILYTVYRTYSELAAQALATLAKAAPDSAPLHQILAQAVESEGDISGAIAEYRKVLDIDPRTICLLS